MLKHARESYPEVTWSLDITCCLKMFGLCLGLENLGGLAPCWSHNGMEPWKPAQRKPGQLGEHTDEYKASSSLYTQKIEQNIKPMSSVHLALWISNHILLDTCSHCGKLPWADKTPGRQGNRTHGWEPGGSQMTCRLFFPKCQVRICFWVLWMVPEDFCFQVLGLLGGSPHLVGWFILVSRCFKWGK